MFGGGDEFFKTVFCEFHERGIFPIGAELRFAATEEIWKFGGGKFDRPLQTAGHRSVRKVCRADESAGKAGVAVDEVGFCVKAGMLGVVVDFNLGI